MKTVWLFLFVLAPVLRASGPSGADLAKEIQNSGLDAQECYRVRDLTLTKEDVKLYFTDGLLIFGKPVAGRRLSAVFAATETEGGDAEILVLPPHRSERQSLAAFAHTPNLNEHFTTSVMLFTDDTAAELLEQIKEKDLKKAPEAGLLAAEKWGSVARNIALSFGIRLVQDALSGEPATAGLFFAAVSGRQLGNIDIIVDPRAREQITLGQVAFRDNRIFFDTWASFLGKSWRTGQRTLIPDEFAVSDIRIGVKIQPDLHMTGVTRMKLKAVRSQERVIAFEVSNRMKVTDAKVDGQPVEVFSRDSLRADLLRGSNNEVFLLVLPTPLTTGAAHEIEIAHQGDVITDAGNGVLFVGSRGNWYPSRGTAFSTFDMTFQVPKALNLVASGDLIEDREEGEWRVIHRRSSTPIRFAGFNLGDYEKAVSESGGVTVEVYANRRIEKALQAKPREMMVMPPPQFPRARRPNDPVNMEMTPIPPPNPAARILQIATDISAAMDFMGQHFGPPPLKKITVSPIPGTFGQGFPGLLYLSTLAYLDPRVLTTNTRNEMQRTFYTEILQAHEAAHQWWGNTVTSSSYQDDWIMESLANYSALLFLEKRKGRKALDAVLEDYRNNLLKKNPDGHTLESAGPIVWGTRLQSSQNPGAWRAITYEKGSWILHMLRGRLGDENFLKMLGSLCQNYRFKALTTEQFQKEAAAFLPPKSADPTLENFFEQWVYGTGVPTLRMISSTTGRAPAVKVKGTVTQTDVDEDFSAYVPVEVQLPGKRTVTKWISTSSEPVPFTIDLKVAPVKVQLDPGSNVLAVRK